MIIIDNRLIRAFAGLFIYCILYGVEAWGQPSPNVTFLGSLNMYNPAPDSLMRYNDCWGYTSPDGTEYALLGVVSGTSIVDISSAPTLNEVAFIPNHRGQESPWKDIKTYRNFAYFVTEGNLSGLHVVDLSFLPDSAVLVKVDTSVFRASHNLSIDTVRGILYSEGDASAPIRVWSLANPANPDFVTSFGPENQQIHDVFAKGNRLYVSEGGTFSYSIYNVEDPSSPILLQRFYTPTNGYAHNSWPTDDERLLMTTEEAPGRTVKIWDISDLDSIRLRGQYLGPSSLAHNTHIKGDFAYISYYKSGLRIVDIRNPDMLVEAGFFDTYSGSFANNFHGAWGAFPFFPSGRILISDMERGLFVVSFNSGGTTSFSEERRVAGGFELGQGYPNPFNPVTTVHYVLPARTDVRLSVFDLLGRELSVLVDGSRDAGSYDVSWNAVNRPSGVYVLLLRTPSGVQSRKLILAK